MNLFLMWIIDIFKIWQSTNRFPLPRKLILALHFVNCEAHFVKWRSDFARFPKFCEDRQTGKSGVS